MMFNKLCFSINTYQMLLSDFSHHHIEMACTLLETCGRFLFRSPESHLRTNVLLVRENLLSYGEVVLSWLKAITPFWNYFINSSWLKNLFMTWKKISEVKSNCFWTSSNSAKGQTQRMRLKEYCSCTWTCLK